MQGFYSRKQEESMQLLVDEVRSTLAFFQINQVVHMSSKPDLFEYSQSTVTMFPYDVGRETVMEKEFLKNPC